LLVAPYQSGAHRHGWAFAGSVVFPLGSAPAAQGHRLLCGRDDGAIAPFEITHSELLQRLQAVRVRPQAGDALDQWPEDELRGLAVLRVDDADRAASVLTGALSTLWRERPMVLLRWPTDPAAAAQVAAVLDRAQYTCEALFAFTPAQRLALPSELRAHFSWLV
jgi:hypothetical protein